MPNLCPFRVSTTLRIYTHPEQLDRATFLRGDLSDSEKLAMLREQYAEVIQQVETFLQ